MSIKKISKDQPDKFEFNADNLFEAKKILERYPKEKKKKCCDGIIISGSKSK